MSPESLLRDVKSEIRSLRSQLDDVEVALDTLSDDIDTFKMDAPEVGTIVLEAASYGLVTIEAKYGLSSNEAKELRKFLSEQE